jgi:cytochrome c oxidase assembly protein subunit 15
MTRPPSPDYACLKSSTKSIKKVEVLPYILTSPEHYMQKRITNWLFFCAGLIFMMIVLGGATRLTGSGLSIVDWKPVSGILPPLTHAGWQDLFQAYQTSPEYQKVNYDMTLEEFKGIFWLEFIHRLWGRLIGLAFLIPMVMSLRYTNLRRQVFPKLFGIWLLGGLQGVVGWYMVKSGLHKDPHVSHYRLAMHLLLGFTTYALTLMYALKLNLQRRIQELALPSSSKSISLFLLFLFGLTVFYGALVAGLKAGLIYNTFPTMDGYWLPPELIHLQPWWLNFLENHATVQWTHRILALLTTLSAILFAWQQRFNGASLWVVAAVLLQASLGIATLLYQVPVLLGVLHQAGALLILTALIAKLFLFCYKSEERSL